MVMVYEFISNVARKAYAESTHEMRTLIAHSTILFVPCMRQTKQRQTDEYYSAYIHVNNI